MSLTDYVTLGRSGVRVSPFCLGTMTFGDAWGWGSPVRREVQTYNGVHSQGSHIPIQIPERTWQASPHPPRGARVHQLNGG